MDALLHEAVDVASDDEGWASLSAVGSNLSRLASDFDTRTYGFAKLKDLIAAHSGYALELRKGADGRANSVFVRSRD